MNNEPEQIRQKVERSRAELSSDVNSLADKVDPRQVVGRRVNRVRGAYQRAKETIMGSAQSAQRTVDVKAGEMSERAYGAMSSMEQKADQATDQVRETASSMQQAASSVPHMARQRTEGSPLAAGLIAFGAGVLVSSLLPRSGPEQQVAGRVKRTASEHSGQLKQAATGTAQHVRDDLRGPTQQAVESVKSSAGEAASKVRDEGRSAGRDVKDQTQRARQNVSPNRG